MMMREKSDTQLLNEARFDYATATERLYDVARTLSRSPNLKPFEKRALVDSARQALHTIASVADFEESMANTKLDRLNQALADFERNRP